MGKCLMYIIKYIFSLFQTTMFYEFTWKPSGQSELLHTRLHVLYICSPSFGFPF